MLNTGINLELAIKCQNNFVDNWMAYSFWYSIEKNLPDAKIVFVLENSIGSLDYFKWVHRFKIKTSKFPNNFECLHPPSIISVRHFDNNYLGPSSSKSENMTCLVDYSEGVGNFNKSKWINSKRAPFAFTKVIKKDCTTVNEFSILKMWDSCLKSYNLL